MGPRSFPGKLYEVLNENGPLLRWGTDRVSVLIHKKRFEEESATVHPSLLRIHSLTGIKRQLYLYGFERVEPPQCPPVKLESLHCLPVRVEPPQCPQVRVEPSLCPPVMVEASQCPPARVESSHRPGVDPYSGWQDDCIQFFHSHFMLDRPELLNDIKHKYYDPTAHKRERQCVIGSGQEIGGRGEELQVKPDDWSTPRYASKYRCVDGEGDGEWGEEYGAVLTDPSHLKRFLDEVGARQSRLLPRDENSGDRQSHLLSRDLLSRGEWENSRDFQDGEETNAILTYDDSMMIGDDDESARMIQSNDEMIDSDAMKRYRLYEIMTLSKPDHFINTRSAKRWHTVLNQTRNVLSRFRKYGCYGMHGYMWNNEWMIYNTGVAVPDKDWYFNPIKQIDQTREGLVGEGMLTVPENESLQLDEQRSSLSNFLYSYSVDDQEMISDEVKPSDSFSSSSINELCDQSAHQHLNKPRDDNHVEKDPTSSTSGFFMFKTEEAEVKYKVISLHGLMGRPEAKPISEGKDEWSHNEVRAYYVL